MMRGMFSSSDHYKKLRKKRLRAGKCAACGLRPPEEGFVTCRPCLVKQAAAGRRQRESRKLVRMGKRLYHSLGMAI
jgi:hypothetical protein